MTIVQYLVYINRRLLCFHFTGFLITKTCKEPLLNIFTWLGRNGTGFLITKTCKEPLLNIFTWLGRNGTIHVGVTLYIVCYMLYKYIWGQHFTSQAFKLLTLYAKAISKLLCANKWMYYFIHNVLLWYIMYNFIYNLLFHT